MAGGTCQADRHHLCVIKADAVCPFAGQLEVTFFAQVAGRQPLIVLSTLTTGTRVVVARNTVVENRVVVHFGGGLPRQRRMAHAAVGRRDDVIRLRDLASGDDTVMAATA